MERCPNCGQQSRVGAKFCTTCGYKMSEPESNAETEPETENIAQVAGESMGENATKAGWPMPSAPPEPSPHSAWAPTPATATSGESIQTSGESNQAPSPSVWSSGLESTWPPPPGEASDAPLPADETDSSNPPEETEIEADATFAEDDGADTAATDRVSRLLDELRDAVFTLQGQPAVDLSPVIADLEVAITPPGAVNPDKLSELRDALLAAREKPRDIDTIVALTGQIDSLVTLVFAYDRANAAIERALEVLRRA